MNSRDIYVIQGTDYRQMTMELLRACDLAGDIGDRKKRIGLKPNLVADSPASKGATTHPELADGILTYLKENGFENLVKLLEENGYREWKAIEDVLVIYHKEAS